MFPEGHAEPDTTINADIVEETGTKPTLRKQGNSKYIRQCNLRVGEEFRVVSGSASLLSRTVDIAALDTDSSCSPFRAALPRNLEELSNELARTERT
ncbi:hypothetical protein PISMIDRAFT_682976 [Pisolithus microcarpus 441]|uniref:Uncharacterized protein n=1 Tax=Pisolithus microcarpus 441 TaxID=765257 RepID=A0A0C9Y4E0_9AGAM|nr:hypothetical protein PISMIDRAFT_682976 [Pisolithus microcarpus 441]